MKKYPIKFKPILKEKVWGGEKLKSKLNKKFNNKTIGESWEISAIKDNLSIISNGDYKGKTILELIKEFKEDFLGDKVYEIYGYQFPLLFKFIDAFDNLSIQLHPNDELSKKRHNSFGKTEMWYVIDADKKSKLYAGFNKKINKDIYLDYLKNNRILDIININEVITGDAFFIDVGTIHAIGKGVLLAEIQQTSDVTYRIYDWDRLDSKGKGRELHNDLALEALDFNKISSCKLNYEKKINYPNNICKCKYFTTNKLLIDSIKTIDFFKIDSFIVYMCINGTAEINANGNKETITKGESILIPAKIKSLIINPLLTVELLEIYIN